MLIYQRSGRGRRERVKSATWRSRMDADEKVEPCLGAIEQWDQGDWARTGSAGR